MIGSARCIHNARTWTILRPTFQSVLRQETSHPPFTLAPAAPPPIPRRAAHRRSPARALRFPPASPRPL